MKRYIIFSLALLTGAFITSCSLDPTVADRQQVEMPDNTSMRQYMDGAYSDLTSSAYYGRNIVILGEVRADNVIANNSSGRFLRASRMDLLATDGDTRDLFEVAYRSLANVNVIINSDLSEIAGAEVDKTHILGEAYALRAMVHFDLLKNFGQQHLNGGSNLGVTYTKEFKGEEPRAPRATVAENKTDIYADIESAIGYLTQATSSQWASNKYNLTLNAVYALKARVGTYFREYDKVRSAAEQVYGKYTATSADNLVGYWSAGDPGAASIFELHRDETSNPGINGLAYIYRGTSYGDIQLREDILADANFGDDDARAAENMIGYEGDILRNLGKYPNMQGHDNLKVFRYEELLLNYAEALVETNASKALEILNEVAESKNGSTYSAATYANILEERRKELMFEGFRFHDFARFGMDIPSIDASNTYDHGLVPAGDNKFALPIPQREINSNPAVEGQQNPGY